ncbi:DExH-box ATP-dependent RNA helicase DExH14-like [Rutidosis leptorrhynchoides]|uniref:DExH-box ATP-dependent RNA helicase DExH14-like n=1 Tax=Rutidosis leptorrhynchoides TaxID=125765 RepID=UPI003A99B606
MVHCCLTESLSSKSATNFICSAYSTIRLDLKPSITLAQALQLSCMQIYQRLTRLFSVIQETFNEALSEKVPYAVDKQRLNDPHAHFCELELPISDYYTDLKSVLGQSIRIIQAMIDVCANSGWLSSSITCMHLLQMVMQGMWFEKDSALRMLPCMTEELVSLLQQEGVSTIQQLMMDDQRIRWQYRFPKLKQDLQPFPRIQVKLRIRGRVVAGENTSSLNVQLVELSNRGPTATTFTPRFPELKEEAWWLVLGNTITSELHALKRISMTNHRLGMKLLLISDCYLGYNQEYSIEQLMEEAEEKS